MDINDAGLSGISIEQLIKAANSTDPMAIDGQSALADLASVGMAKLKDVADRLGSEPGQQAQTDLLVGLLEDRTLHALGAAWRISEGQVLSIFARLRTVRGHKATVEDVLRAVKRSAGKQESQLRERLRGAIEARNTPKTLSKLLKHDEIPTGLKCPDGWELDNAGVWSIRISEDGTEERTCIAPAPILVVGRSIDISDGETQLRVGWKRANRWTFRTIPRATVMDARPLVSLAKWDAPVSSRNASNLVQYLCDFEAANIEKLPTDKTTRHMGWQDADGSAGFLLGQKQFHLEGDKVTLVPDDGLEQLSNGWTTDGTWDGWLRSIEPALSRPMLMLALYASAATPLLRVLDAPNFIVDWSGETSRGKTTALRVAASVWGCPDERSGGIMYSWDATRVWIEQSAGFMHSLPLILDDTKRARYKQTVSQVLYDFAFGQGRGRGAPNGVRAQASWRSILLTTGEAPATGFSEDAGTRARVISLKGSPLGAQSVENAQVAMGLKHGLMNNHGHLGCRMIDYLVSNRHNWDQIKQQYHERRDSYVESAGDDGVAARLAVYVAVLDVAASIMHSLGVPEPQVDPMSVVWSTVLDGSLDADRPTEALRDLIGWAVANQTRFWGRHETDKLGTPNLPSGGWAGQWKKFDDWESISILPAIAKDLLRRWDYDLNSVLEAWVRRGWLQTNGRSRTWPVSIDGQRARCMVLKREAAEIVLNADD